MVRERFSFVATNSKAPARLSGACAVAIWLIRRNSVGGAATIAMIFSLSCEGWLFSEYKLYKQMALLKDIENNKVLNYTVA